MSCFKGFGLKGNKEVYQVKHFLPGVARLSSYSSIVANYKSSVRRSVHYYCVTSSLEHERSIFGGGGSFNQNEKIKTLRKELWKNDEVKIH